MLHNSACGVFLKIRIPHMKFSCTMSAAWHDELSEYRVSTLKPLLLHVALLNEDGVQAGDHPPFRVEASLLYENGEEIIPVDGESPLSNSSNIVTMGKATLKTKVGVLSSQHRGKRFRMLIRAPGEQITPMHTEPIRTVTKLSRKRSGNYSELQQNRDELERQGKQLKELSASIVALRDEIRILYRLFEA
jgi:hypothetical protein